MNILPAVEAAAEGEMISFAYLQQTGNQMLVSLEPLRLKMETMPGSV